ncbi:MAG: LysR family transcriptional regulator [Sutterellaceae bacterium]|nr:LysR family transcriptional regulator [Sutterellaceae bacterium]MDY2869083.1 LysR family transcriptional regulator [Mesosutterella sp.]
MQNLSDVSLDLLRVFHETARLGSMTEAAQALFVTQPAVSRSIGLLEARLGVKLFARSGRTLVLTPEGHAVFEATRGMMRELQLGEKRLSRLLHLEEGDISVALPVGLLHGYLIPFLQRFNREHPGIRFHIQIENRKAVLRELARAGRADIALEAVHDAGPEPGLEIEPLSLYRHIFAASRTRFPELEGRSLTLGELNRFPLIVLRKGSDSRDFLEARWREEGLVMNIGGEGASSAVVEDFARAGLGVGALIRKIGSDRLPAGDELFEVKLASPLPPGHFVLIRKAGAEPSAAAELFSGLLEEDAGTRG